MSVTVVSKVIDITNMVNALREDVAVIRSVQETNNRYVVGTGRYPSTPLVCIASTYMHTRLNREYYQHSHNAILHWNFQKDSVKILYAIID